MNDTPTPETDGMTFFAQSGMMPPYNAVSSEFARKLERERDAALAENTAMREAIREAHDALNWTLRVLPPPFYWQRFQVANAVLAKLQSFIIP